MLDELFGFAYSDCSTGDVTGWILLFVVRDIGVTLTAGVLMASGACIMGTITEGVYCLAYWSVSNRDLFGYGLVLCTGW